MTVPCVCVDSFGDVTEILTLFIFFYEYAQGSLGSHFILNMEAVRISETSAMSGVIIKKQDPH
jgi:hypothetical protein